MSIDTWSEITDRTDENYEPPTDEDYERHTEADLATMVESILDVLTDPGEDSEALADLEAGMWFIQDTLLTRLDRLCNEVAVMRDDLADARSRIREVEHSVESAVASLAYDHDSILARLDDVVEDLDLNHHDTTERLEDLRYDTLEAIDGIDRDEIAEWLGEAIFGLEAVRDRLV